jgi:HEAT repeat protein
MRAVAVVLVLLAIAGCAERGPQPPSVPELISMLQSDDADAQRKACSWVGILGPQSADATPALIAALKSPETSVREHAAVALRHVGPRGAEAVPALTNALSDPVQGVREAAATTLGQLGPAAASAIPALEQFSAQGDQCGSAKAALKKIRP